MHSTQIDILLKEEKTKIETSGSQTSMLTSKRSEIGNMRSLSQSAWAFAEHMHRTAAFDSIKSATCIPSDACSSRTGSLEDAWESGRDHLSCGSMASSGAEQVGEDALVLQWLAEKLPQRDAQRICGELQQHGALQRVALPSGRNRALSLHDVSSQHSAHALKPSALRRCQRDPSLLRMQKGSRSGSSPAQHMESLECGMHHPRQRALPGRNNLLHARARVALKLLVRRRSHTLACYNIAVGGDQYSTGGGILATGSDDGLIKLHRLSTGRLVCTCTAHSLSPIMDIECSHAKQDVLLTGSLDGVLCAWSLREQHLGSSLFCSRIGSAITSIASVYGSLFVVTSDDGSVRLVDGYAGIIDRVSLQTHTTSAEQGSDNIGSSNNSNGVQLLHSSATRFGYVAVACGQPLCCVKLLHVSHDCSSLQHSATLDDLERKPVTLVSFSDNACNLLASYESGVALYAYNFSENKYEYDCTLRVRGSSKRKARVLMATFCCGGSCVAVSTESLYLQVFATRTGQLLHTMAPFKGMCYVLYAHPHDSSLLVAASWDGRLTLVDCRRGELIKQLQEPNRSAFLDARVLPSGDVACSDQDGYFSIVGNGAGPSELHRYTANEQFLSLPEHYQPYVRELHSISCSDTQAKLSDADRRPYDHEYIRLFQSGSFTTTDRNAEAARRHRRTKLCDHTFHERLFSTSVCRVGEEQPAIEKNQSTDASVRHTAQPRAHQQHRQSPQQQHSRQHTSWLDEIMSQINSRVNMSERLSLQAQIQANDDGLDFDDENDEDYDATQEEAEVEEDDAHEEPGGAAHHYSLRSHNSHLINRATRNTAERAQARRRSRRLRQRYARGTEDFANEEAEEEHVQLSDGENHEQSHSEPSQHVPTVTTRRSARASDNAQQRQTLEELPEADSHNEENQRNDHNDEFAVDALDEAEVDDDQLAEWLAESEEAQDAGRVSTSRRRARPDMSQVRSEQHAQEAQQGETHANDRDIANAAHASTSEQAAERGKSGETKNEQADVAQHWKAKRTSRSTITRSKGRHEQALVVDERNDGSRASRLRSARNRCVRFTSYADIDDTDDDMDEGDDRSKRARPVRDSRVRRQRIVDDIEDPEQLEDETDLYKNGAAEVNNRYEGAEEEEEEEEKEQAQVSRDGRRKQRLNYAAMVEQGASDAYNGADALQSESEEELAQVHAGKRKRQQTQHDCSEGRAPRSLRVS